MNLKIKIISYIFNRFQNMKVYVKYNILHRNLCESSYPFKLQINKISGHKQK